MSANARSLFPARTCPTRSRRRRMRPEIRPRVHHIPVPFYPRLISFVPPAIASAAMETARAHPIVGHGCLPRAASLAPRSGGRRPQRVYGGCGDGRSASSSFPPKAKEEQVYSAGPRGESFVHQGLGSALLVGREDRVRDSAHSLVYLARDAPSRSSSAAVATQFTYATSALPL